MTGFTFRKELILVKQVHEKNISFTIGIFRLRVSVSTINLQQMS